MLPLLNLLIFICATKCNNSIFYIQISWNSIPMILVIIIGKAQWQTIAQKHAIKIPATTCMSYIYDTTPVVMQYSDVRVLSSQITGISSVCSKLNSGITATGVFHHKGPVSWVFVSWCHFGIDESRSCVHPLICRGRNRNKISNMVCMCVFSFTSFGCE